MARKGQSRHLKRYAAPRALTLPRKSVVWTVKPAPGPHPSSESIPLRLVVREYLGLARTAREVDRLLSEKRVLVDGRVRKNSKFPVGLMDVVQLPALNKSYRVLLDVRGRLILREIPQAETQFKLCKVVRKDVISGRKIQLTFNDGKTLSGDFGEFKLRDVAKLSLPDPKILERIAYEKGTAALVTGGRNVGRLGKIVEVKLIEGTQPNIVILEAADGTTFQTPEDYVFAVGKRKIDYFSSGVIK